MSKRTITLLNTTFSRIQVTLAHGQQMRLTHWVYKHTHNHDKVPASRRAVAEGVIDVKDVHCDMICSWSTQMERRWREQSSP